MLADRVRRGEIVPPAGIEQAMRTDYAPQTLLAMREQAFSIVAEHAERRLAEYRASGLTAAARRSRSRTRSPSWCWHATSRSGPAAIACCAS